MHKIRIIAARDFLAAVRSKMFIVTLLFLPILMGISIGIQVLFQKAQAEKPKRCAVIDRTPGQKIGLHLQRVGALLGAKSAENPEFANLQSLKVDFDPIAPRPLGEEQEAQLFELSQRMEQGEFEAIIEIGPKAAEIRNLANLLTTDPKKVPDESAVVFRSKSPTAFSIKQTAEVIINQAVQMERFSAKGIAEREVALLQQPVILKLKSLVRKDEATGGFVESSNTAAAVNFVLPGVMIAMMFMAIMIGATPAMHGVVEEKSMRIAEVLLGSATPFQIMAGKLLGVIGVSLSIAAAYLGGGYALAFYFGFASLVPPAMLLWFLPMLVLAMLIFGSLFIAVGAAATDIKDTQTLLMPIMMIACIPFFALGPILLEPNGTIARVCSLFPFASPMLLTARQSVPPGVPLGEMLACVAVTLLTTLACVWAAGRIFRVGILMQGKSPRLWELLRWAIKG